MDGGCVEHVWQLVEVGQCPDGRLSQTYGCRRCLTQLLVGPDDLGPMDPDWPVG